MDEDLLWKILIPIIVFLLGLIVSGLAWIGIRMISRLDNFIEKVTKNQLEWNDKHHGLSSRVSVLDEKIKARIDEARNR